MRPRLTYANVLATDSAQDSFDDMIQRATDKEENVAIPGEPTLPALVSVLLEDVAELVTELWNLAALNEQTGQDDPVFVGERGTRQTPSNVGRRLKSAIKKAHPVLEEKGIEPINERVPPHSLRRTFASLRFAAGDDPVRVAEQGRLESPDLPDPGLR
jgi:integrase